MATSRSSSFSSSSRSASTRGRLPRKASSPASPGVSQQNSLKKPQVSRTALQSKGGAAAKKPEKPDNRSASSPSSSVSRSVTQSSSSSSRGSSAGRASSGSARSGSSVHYEDRSPLTKRRRAPPDTSPPRKIRARGRRNDSLHREADSRQYSKHTRQVDERSKVSDLRGGYRTSPRSLDSKINRPLRITRRNSPAVGPARGNYRGNSRQRADRRSFSNDYKRTQYSTKPPAAEHGDSRTDFGGQLHRRSGYRASPGAEHPRKTGSSPLMSCVEWGRKSRYRRSRSPLASSRINRSAREDQIRTYDRGQLRGTMAAAYSGNRGGKRTEESRDDLKRVATRTQDQKQDDRTMKKPNDSMGSHGSREIPPDDVDFGTASNLNDEHNKHVATHTSPNDDNRPAKHPAGSIQGPMQNRDIHKSSEGGAATHVRNTPDGNVLNKTPLQAASHKNTLAVDRTKITPFLVRVFIKINAEHDISAFPPHQQGVAAGELQIYTWMDAKLRELVNLIKDGFYEARERNALWKFSLIYPNKQGRNAMLSVGTVHSTRSDPREDNKTLQQVKFQIGDYIGLSIIIPKRRNFPRVPPNERVNSANTGDGAFQIDSSQALEPHLEIEAKQRAEVELDSKEGFTENSNAPAGFGDENKSFAVHDLNAEE